MTLGTVLLGLAPVVLLFLVAARVSGRKLSRGVAIASLAEASCLVLAGALWFGSLGHGSWVVLFLLIGLMAAAIERGAQTAFLRSAFPREALLASLTVARYLAAGGLLAWLLG